ncbi:DUF1192 domain-containing protein [Phreatobacter aquaticus]|uniref:DUF1192 domain-containing protein n=1 Tax=Phreatobacter aquaticus TaxID=2570229 RepID=A0A4D7QTD1_9HYPH|nr:DUF1192 domain-containing protein [Phreatobacter aquaticus]QCK88464.1 DUF1192 domain-containing protein [Phreatobacter aquaticus]
MDEDLRPRPKPPAHVIGQDLAALSIHELKERVEVLKDEIVRLEAAVQSKSASKNAADSVFKF